jgi:hypothetical protein
MTEHDEVDGQNFHVERLAGGHLKEDGVVGDPLPDPSVAKLKAMRGDSEDKTEDKAPAKKAAPRKSSK